MLAADDGFFAAFEKDLNECKALVDEYDEIEITLKELLTEDDFNVMEPYIQGNKTLTSNKCTELLFKCMS